MGVQREDARGPLRSAGAGDPRAASLRDAGHRGHTDYRRQSELPGVDRSRDIHAHLLSAESAQRLCSAEMGPTMEMPRGSRSTSLEEMVIEHLRSLSHDKQESVSVP